MGARATANTRETRSEPRAWRIAELAEEFGLTHRAIRFYEDQGLIRPQRRGATRLYGPRERTRLALITRGKRIGFSLAEIKELLELADLAANGAGADARRLVQARARYDERIGALEAQRAEIDDALDQLRRHRAALDTMLDGRGDTEAYQRLRLIGYGMMPAGNDL